jgi:uncharacterized protein YxjI
MQFPLSFTFKIMALAPQIFVRDASGTVQMYVRQKLMKLKEAITVFSDEAQTTPIYTINADRVIDWSARYRIAEAGGGRELGAIKRQGMRSIWRAQYDIERDGAVVMSVREANPWVKVMDHLLTEIPGLGLLTGYFFHPAYIVSRTDGTQLLKLQKQAAFLEGRFKLDTLATLSEEDERLAVLGLLMMLLLERRRG